MSRVAIIGAGIAGLSAAARLAAAGHDVVVHETSSTIGGKVGLAEHETPAGTFRFDTGPSLLTYPTVFAELFSETGAPIEQSLILRRLDPVIRYRFADGSMLDAFDDPGQLQREIDTRLGSSAGADWAAFLRRGGAMWRAAEGPFLRSELTMHSALQAARHWPRLASIAPGRSLHDLATGYLRDPRLRMMAERYATYAGGSPRRIPAVYAVIAYLEMSQGGWYIDGGIRKLAQAIAERAEQLGARIQLDSPITAIEAGGGSVRGLRRRDGRVEPADVVISTADAAFTYNQLLSGGPARGVSWAAIALRGRRRRLDRAPRSLAGFSMLLGVRGRTPGARHHNVLFPRHYGQEFDAIFAAPARLPADPTIYVSVSTDPAHAPAGHEAWFVLVNVPRHRRGGAPDALDWSNPELAATLGERTLSLLAARGLPVRERLVLTRVRTPEDLETETGTPGGAIYGTAPHGAVRSLRPANATPIRGLFLAGGTAHPGGGMPLAALSAATVARLIGPA
jgi:phytoene desaturase